VSLNQQSKGEAKQGRHSHDRKGGRDRSRPERKKSSAPPPEALESRFGFQHPSTPILLGLILAFSLILGVVCVLQFRHSPFSNLPIIDEESYVEWGKRIAAGEVLGKTIFYQDPLYPYSLGLVFSIFGVHYLLVRLLQVGMGVLSVAVVFWTARKMLGERLALLAAAILALYRGLYFFELQLLKGSMVIFFSALSCALGVAAVEKPRSSWRWIGLGLSLGLLTLLRGNFQALLPFVLIWAFAYAWKDPLRDRLVRALALALGLALVIVPVTMRNYVIGGEWVLTTSQGGANFYIGNNPLADGRYVTLPFVRANPRWEAEDFKAEAEKRSGRELRPSEVSSFWFRESWAWIKANPGQALRLLLHKARLMIHQYEIPDNHSLYLTREQFVPALWLAFWGFGILWGPGLLGLGLLVQKDRRSWYPALFAVLYSASLIPFFIVDRYRLAVVPAMAVFSAGLVGWVIHKWKESRARPLLWAGAGLALSLALGFLPTRESQTSQGPEYYLLANAYLKTGRPAEAVAWYDQAIPRLSHPEDAVRNRAEAMRRLHGGDIASLLQKAQDPELDSSGLIGLAREAEKLGQMPLAAELYQRAATQDPANYSAHARLGFIYCTDPELRNFEKGRDHLNQALRIKPQDLDTMNALGNCEFLAGNTAQARTWWEAILKIQPGFESASKNLQLLKEHDKK